MKLIKTTAAVGHVLCHDMTRIVPGMVKGPAFYKGHIVTEEDIPVLLSMGKEHLYIWQQDDSQYHENEAAEILCALCKNENIESSVVKEGKIELFAAADGLFKVVEDKIHAINALGDMIISTRHGNLPVRKGEQLAGTRIIPLVIEKDKVVKAREIAGAEPLLTLLPIQKKKAAIVTTGNEIFEGRVQDAFGPVVRNILKEYEAQVVGQVVVNSNSENITNAIQALLAQGAQMVIVTGGMSVDPDDTTPTAIRNTGAELITYGAPVLPGAMFLLAYTTGGIPIIGLPGCVMFARRTIFDLMLPRLLADDRLTSGDFHRMGVGGLCLQCETCTFPCCAFGK